MPQLAFVLTSAILLSAASASAAPTAPSTKPVIALTGVTKAWGCARGFRIDPAIGKCVRNGHR